MTHEKVVAILLWIAFAGICGSIVKDCAGCELHGGVYIRGVQGHCLDPQTGKVKP